MRRQDLIDVLEELQPVLPPKSGRHDERDHFFWFTGERVMVLRTADIRAQTAMSLPLRTAFKGGIGSVLLDLLKRSASRRVTLAAQPGRIVIKAGRTEMAFPQITSFIPCELPSPSGGSRPVSADFFDALEFCMGGIGSDPNISDQLGITVEGDGNGSAKLYTTNNATIRMATVKLAMQAGRFLVSGLFCRQLIRVRRPGQLELHDDYVLFSDATGLMLWDRLIKPETPLDFGSVMDFHIEGVEDHLVEVPSELLRVLNHMIPITDNTEHNSMEITVERYGKMRFRAESKYGEVEHELRIDWRHPLVQVRAEPRLIRDGKAYFEKWVVTEKAVILRKGNKTILIGSTGE
jgi:hypothetical protein